jgi:hypothetical protein
VASKPKQAAPANLVRAGVPRNGTPASIVKRTGGAQPTRLGPSGGKVQREEFSATSTRQASPIYTPPPAPPGSAA